MRRRGFTFIEVMLVTAIFATLAVAVFTCLSNGIKLWERGNRLMVNEDAIIFFDRFASDLRNTFAYSKISFEGETTQLTFPTIVWTPADRVSVRASEAMIDQIGRVQYAYDGERGLLIRRQANYSQALHGSWGMEEAVVPWVRSLRFHYFYGTSKDPHMAADPGNGTPSGVEVELTVLEGAAERVLRRYVAIAVGA